MGENDPKMKVILYTKTDKRFVYHKAKSLEVFLFLQISDPSIVIFFFRLFPLLSFFSCA